MNSLKAMVVGLLIGLPLACGARHPGEIGYGEKLEDLTESTIEKSEHGGPHVPAARVTIYKDGHFKFWKCPSCVEYTVFPPPNGSGHENVTIEKIDYGSSVKKYVDKPDQDPCIFWSMGGSIRVICW